jgi:hypothetical protein
MPAVSVTVQMSYIGNNACAQRVEMDIPDQFQQVGIFLADNGLESVLKKGAMTKVSAIEADDVSGQQPVHEFRKALCACAQEKMCVVGQKGPGIAGSLCRRK